MLSWLFKKRGAAAAPAPARPVKPAPPVAAPKAAAQPVPEVDWPARLAAAQGDDAALLALLQQAAPLAIKLEAVQALDSEAALKQAERDGRGHDRKVHRLAKQRHADAVTQRESRATAQVLLARAEAWQDEARLPVNHLVALDRDWEALPAHALTPAQRDAFADLRARLAAQVQAKADAQQRLQRWTAEAGPLLATGRARLLAIAAHGHADHAAGLAEAAAALQASHPQAEAVPAQALMHLQQQAEQLQALLVDLAAAPAPAEAPTDTGAETASVTALVSDERRLALDEAIAQALAQRRQQALPDQPPVAEAPAAAAPPRSAPDEARRSATRQRLEAALQLAEAALADGHVAEMQQQLQAIDSALGKSPQALPESWRGRLQALRAERDRLKGWQQWGGSRVRDELLAEAEALARRVAPAVEPAAAEMPAADTPTAEAGLPLPVVVPASPAPKLNLKAQADAIHALRQRWKALDHQGAPASAEQWQRFDGALQIAHQPVAAQQAVLKAARQENLAAREALLDALEGMPMPADGVAVRLDDGSELPAADGAPDWRACQRELDQFNAAWRKLGPVEHTVPAAARDGLQQRLQQALARVEVPLRQARAVATAEREQLVAAALSLAPAGGDGRLPAEALRQVRALQADWSDHARRLPLPRALETALWARFKAATDAVFAQRDAMFAARDAERAGQQAAREALLQRLGTLDVALAPAELGRQLAEIDRDWRRQGESPQGGGDALDRPYRAARAAVEQRLADGHRRHWQAQVDTLAARLAACERGERGETGESGAAPVTADAELPPSGPGNQPDAPLPAAWAKAMDQRLARPAGPGPLPAAELDELLLRLEIALDLPAAPDWQAARQQLKLRALKDAMEGRRSAQDGPAAQAAWWSAVLGQSGLDAAQRARLQALLAALRQAPPGALGAG